MRRGIHPARLIVMTYGLALAIGTAVLMLPAAHAGAGRATFVEAIFTATSALCVTGLLVVDTPTFWTPLGKIIILLLIQVGGLGIMSVASMLGLIVMRRSGLRSRLTAAHETRSLSTGEAKRVIKGIVKSVLIIELVVATMLFIRHATAYSDGKSLLDSAWFAVFHAVSAFNNAGFALQSNSLMDFVGDAWICLPIAGAVILGGLGYPVLRQLWLEYREPLHWTMNTRLVLSFTGALFALGLILTCAAEWNNSATMGPLDTGEKFLAGFIHSVAARSSGFSTIATDGLEPVTLFGTDVLMFIGGGPAGTAGGIKVTTFAVLFFIIYTELRGERAVNIFGKRLPRSVHRQAIAVALLSVAAVVGSTMVLLAITDFGLEQTLFEVISAFCTVGLSTGITGDLPDAGQLFLVVLMFVGRLGPITLATALVLVQRQRQYELPKDRPYIG